MEAILTQLQQQVQAQAEDLRDLVACLRSLEARLSELEALVWERRVQRHGDE